MNNIVIGINKTVKTSQDVARQEVICIGNSDIELQLPFISQYLKKSSLLFHSQTKLFESILIVKSIRFCDLLIIIMNNFDEA